MGKCTTPVVRTHTEWVKCPQCEIVSRGTVWHKRPRVYQFRCKCGHELINEQGVRPWVVASQNQNVPF